MTRLYDTFLFDDELDMLECRLTELDASPVYRFVIVEATVTHRGDPKPLFYAENADRFSPWADRIIHVVAGTLPDSPDPWQRLFAQREHARAGLGDATADDVIMHGDADEIPSASACARALAGPGAAFAQRCAVYAADWLYPDLWRGTVAVRYGSIGSFTGLRERAGPLIRALPGLPDGGWHLSWMGGAEGHLRKLKTHCHLEMTAETHEAIASGRFYREGWHSDGKKLIPATVDVSWPRWVFERKCPASWFRPRP